MIKVGSCAWNHKDWVGSFYQENRTPWLTQYSARFSTVEINATFHSIPAREDIIRWSANTPDGFVFSVKLPWKITHYKRLHQVRRDMEKFCDVIEGLGEKLGPILVQFPPQFTKDENIDIFRKFVPTLPRHLKWVFEFRSEKWYCNEIYEYLARYRYAFCMIDFKGLPRIEIVTAPFVYIRLIGDRKAIMKTTAVWNRTVIDRTDEIKWWAGKIASFEQKGLAVYCYANNHYEGYAVATIEKLNKHIKDGAEKISAN